MLKRAYSGAGGCPEEAVSAERSAMDTSGGGSEGAAACVAKRPRLSSSPASGDGPGGAPVDGASLVPALRTSTRRPLHAGAPAAARAGAEGADGSDGAGGTGVLPPPRRALRARPPKPDAHDVYRASGGRASKPRASASGAGDGASFKCAWEEKCTFVTAAAQGLAAHVKAHSGERPFPYGCAIGGCSFVAGA